MKYLKLKNKIKKLEDEKFSLSWSKFKLERENKELRERIESLVEEIKFLKAPKATINIKASVSGEELANEIVKKLKEEKEHKCTPECFEEHVIKVIQTDYAYRPKVSKDKYIKYWYEKLSKNYPWLESLFIINGKISFSVKRK